MKLIGRTGPVAGRDASIGDTLRIGASVDNDFRVEVTGISRHHARVVRDGADFWLEDTGSTNGTFVNGLRVARERLRHLDVVTLGRGVDLIAIASEAAASSAAMMHAIRSAWLDPMDPQVGVRIDVPPGELTLGRSAPSNVLLDSPLVSHLHARLERTPDHLVVTDLASSNGTFVNGRLIREPVELMDGDALSIAGSRQFRVCIEGTVRRDSGPITDTGRTPVDSEWKTRLVWSADELVELEADRQRILAAWKKEQAAAAAKPAVAPKADAPPKPVAAPPPKPVAAAPPKPAPPPPKPAPPAKPASPAKPEAAVKPDAPSQPVAPPKPVAPAKPVVTAKPEAAKPDVAKPAPPVKHAEPAKPVEAPKPVEAEKPAPPAPSRVVPIRHVTLTGSAGTFKLGLGRHDVGRSDSIAMTLLSPQVSRMHAAIIVTTKDVRVEDAKSANGTLVNGTKLPIGGAQSIKTGDRVSFGNVEFTVEVS